MCIKLDIIMSEGVIFWQIFDRDEGWKDFPKDISSSLERAFRRNPREMLSYVKSKTRYF